MRTAIAVRSLCIAAAVAAVAIACGSSDSSQFTDPNAGLDEAGVTPPTGTFVPAEAGPTTDGGPSTCKPLTCVDRKATCGPIGDGCGNVVQCGTCDATKGETCGGGGVPSACGKPACTPLSCADNGATCGIAADGCGGQTPSCGTCNTAIGESCNGVPSKCSVLVAGADGGADAGPACVPTTCAALGQNCGGTPDGCGGFIPSCGTCGPADTCGGGGVPSVCGHTCKPLTACPAGLNCGPIADGCGGIISCGGACAVPGQICGGGTPGAPNVCGGDTTCTGLCAQQTTCPGGGTTSISGTVTTPNGVLPIYGALVYVPNGAVQAFTTGVTCEQCGAASGAPLVSTTTGPDGKFLLSNVPVSSTAAGKTNDIPVVIQLGRWRKQFTVVTTGCTNTLVPAGSSALPHNKAEGDIPLTAISTGQVDGLECVFRKIGIDDAEFTDPTGNGRIRFYKDNGAVKTTQTFGPLQCSIGGAACGTTAQKSACTKAPPTGLGGTCITPQTGGTPAASTLYNDPNELAKYDLSIFECVGGEQTKSATARANVLDYANKGGRVYATHYSYVWLNNTSPWSTTATWGPQQDAWTSIVADLDTTFGKGQAFAQWLNIVGGLQAPLPATPPPWVPAPQITIQEARHDADYPVSAAAQRWLYTTAASTGALKPSLQHYTFNTDVNKAAAQQCGRVLFSDFHVSTGSNTTDKVFPAECNNTALTTQEKVLAFMLFDLASCVNTVPPAPPSCTPKTCAQQGIDCGQAGDGCGNVITCPPCAAGTTCGGAGTPNKCGAPPCAKKTCAAGQCGTIADGCGGSVVCAPCAAGTCGGGGTPNMCGVGVCTPSMCPAPAAGSSCGPVADGCGGLNSCACPAGTPCVNGKCTAPPCTPISCGQAGANCGQVADGCGKLNDCGMCLAPQICGGGGTPNVCGGGVN
jgi:hypothetical protein